MSADPIIDRAPAADNVWIAAGHNMVGISMAPGTGRLIGELVSGRAIVPLRETERTLDQLEESPFIEAELEPEQHWEEPVVAQEPDAIEPIAAEYDEEAAPGTRRRPPRTGPSAQPAVTSTAARFFLPRRSTSQRPCSRSSSAGTASSAVTLTLFT